MAGNTFGQLFRITTAGESHGPGNMVIIDGVPPGMALSVDDLRPDLDPGGVGAERVVALLQSHLAAQSAGAYG